MPKIIILPLPKISGSGVINTSGEKIFTPSANTYWGDFKLSILIPLPTLNSPTISLQGNILTISKGTANGDFIPSTYIIYRNGTELIEIEGGRTKTFDLSTLITQEGSYNIYVKATREQFRNSSASNTVVYSTEQPPYTVLIKELRGAEGLEWSAFDGQNASGKYLKVFSSESSLPISLQISSGYLYLQCQDSTYLGDTSESLIIQNISITNNPVSLTYKVRGSGEITYISATDIP